MLKLWCRSIQQIFTLTSDMEVRKGQLHKHFLCENTDFFLFWLKKKHPWVLAWDNIKYIAFPSPVVICANYVFFCYLYTVLFGHCNFVVLYVCRSLLKTSLYTADVTFLSKEYKVTFAEVELGQKHGTIQNIMWSNSTSLNFPECVAGHIQLSSPVYYGFSIEFMLLF